MTELNKTTCTVDIEDSKAIKIGNIYSDADKALKLRKVEELTIGDIYHFTKSEKEVEQVFSIIKNAIITCNIDAEVEKKALELSHNVKNSYLSKDPIGFKANYLQFTGFLANHTGIAGFIMPIVQSLIS